LEGSLSHLLDSSQKRVSSLELALKEANEGKAEWQQRAELLQLKSQAGDSRAGLESQLSKVVKERDQVQGELLSLQMEAGGRMEKLALFEAKVKKLQAEQVETQVENSTLQAQSSSLLAQINQLQVANQSLEVFKRKVGICLTSYQKLYCLLGGGVREEVVW